MARSFPETYKEQIDFQVNQALAWLNKFDREAITSVTEPFLTRASQIKTSLSDAKLQIERAVVLSRRYENTLETPEVQVRGAVILYFRGDFETAEAYLEEAIAFYDLRNHRHRHAISCLILGFVSLAQEKRGVTLAVWDVARKSFQTCVEQAERDPMRSYRDPYDEKVKFYMDRLSEAEVNDVLIPEKVISWLDRYDPISLNVNMLMLKDKLYDEASKREPDLVRRAVLMASDLSVRDEDPQVTALMMGHAGMALFLVGEKAAALDYLSQSVILCKPNSHQRMVLTWLKALVEWQVPENRKEAVRSSQAVIEAVEGLELRADYKDRQTRMGWYHRLGISIGDASERMFKLFLPDLI